ncbi:Acetyltransferase involved in cellulose biosynthesis, CelD/BcsL family [Pseudonocardia ammonioxydans]|uniref:Acetyltransferase involved in cellulose biosynthesis, CelD/BcsL family n=1 Tax=Pseudonocardia ammonioxydans TaxID=260086 RepID=A0A1I5CIQ6_PSUAM|nr:GNAT family N-acetyltransferase [Pseudonocardia ammonioxydans]SFN86890.1 Acetyltransferase involved in cellulose biosynthesis, CelD/BcsL family [Pseudonocardia ammonioxydans]
MTARVERVDPRTDPAWRELAAHGDLFTAPPWLSAVCDHYGFVPEARLVRAPDGTPAAGLAWVDVADVRGQRRLGLPFSDRGDPVVRPGVDTDDAWAAVAADICDDSGPTLTLRCLDTSVAATDERFAVVGEAAWHVTPLAPAEDLHRRLRPHVRRNLAAAQRNGLRVVLRDDLSAVAEYHRLHLRLRKEKYRLLAQPLEFFEQVWKAFAPHGGIRVGLVDVGGPPIAGAIYLVWQDTVYYKFGASAGEHLHLRPNEALHWACLRWAADQGLSAMDWGLSDLDQPGLVRFKRGWATREQRIRTLRPHGSLPTHTPVDELLGDLTRLLTGPEVPDRVTDQAGALLYRYFC